MAYTHTWTSIVCSSTSFTFSSQGTTTYKFSFNNISSTAPYNPLDIIDQAPPYRGSSRNTIGGNRVEQYFGSYVCDGNITFSCYLTREEVVDFKAAFALGATWVLKDYTGGSYTVTFEFTDGFRVGAKVQANDKYWCNFKFKKAAIS